MLSMRAVCGPGPQSGQSARRAMVRRRSTSVRPSKVTSWPSTGKPSSRARARSACAAPDDPDHRPHDPCLGAVGRLVRGEHVLEQAPVARAAAGAHGERRADPAHGRGVDDRDARQRARVGSEKLRREVVGPLEHDVVLPDERQRVVRQEARPVQPELRRRRSRVSHGAERPRGRVELRRPDVGVGEQDLPVKVRALDDVVVAEAQRGHPGASQR